MKRMIPILMVSLVALLAQGAEVETPAQRDARMAWRRKARFGMFVHWELYSGLAGTWEGKPVGTTGGMEWLQQYVKADTATYAAAAVPHFQPDPGSPRSGPASPRRLAAAISSSRPNIMKALRCTIRRSAQAVGRWMRANGEAIYGTSASPFANLHWGRCTQKPGTLYLLVFDWPKDGTLRVPGLKSGVRTARLFAGGDALRSRPRTTIR